jgi:hypothetical protein
VVARLGVAVILAVLIIVPDKHASADFVFTERFNNSGFPDSMFWFYVLPLGFLLTQYTITGFDSCAHISEETHGAADSRRQGRVAVDLLLGGSSAGSCCWPSPSPPPTSTPSTRTRPAAPTSRCRSSSTRSTRAGSSSCSSSRRSGSCSAAPRA